MTKTLAMVDLTKAFAVQLKVRCDGANAFSSLRCLFLPKLRICAKARNSQETHRTNGPFDWKQGIESKRIKFVFHKNAFGSNDGFCHHDEFC